MTPFSSHCGSPFDDALFQHALIVGKQVFIDRNRFAALLPEAGEAELRNVRILTPDKTEMMHYIFY